MTRTTPHTELTMDQTDRLLLSRYLERSADYHDRHGGPVTVDHTTAARFHIEAAMTPADARGIAISLRREAAA